MPSDFERLFPLLARSGYQVTSAADRHYNCIAWAIGDSSNWWWPEEDAENGHWPRGVGRDVTIESFLAAFATLGFLPCANAAAEPGCEKIALFATADGTPTHAARQLANGRWTSKLGKLEDIEHDLNALTGAEYGSVVLVLKRATRQEVQAEGQP